MIWNCLPKKQQDSQNTFQNDYLQPEPSWVLTTLQFKNELMWLTSEIVHDSVCFWSLCKRNCSSTLQAPETLDKTGAATETFEKSIDKENYRLNSIKEISNKQNKLIIQLHVI